LWRRLSKLALSRARTLYTRITIPYKQKILKTILKPNKISTAEATHCNFFAFCFKIQQTPIKRAPLHKTLTSSTDQIPENPMKYFIYQFISTNMHFPKGKSFWSKQKPGAPTHILGANQYLCNNVWLPMNDNYSLMFIIHSCSLIP